MGGGGVGRGLFDVYSESDVCVCPGVWCVLAAAVSLCVTPALLLPPVRRRYSLCAHMAQGVYIFITQDAGYSRVWEVAIYVRGPPLDSLTAVSSTHSIAYTTPKSHTLFCALFHF